MEFNSDGLSASCEAVLIPSGGNYGGEKAVTAGGKFSCRKSNRTVVIRVPIFPRFIMGKENNNPGAVFMAILQPFGVALLAQSSQIPHTCIRWRISSLIS